MCFIVVCQVFGIVCVLVKHDLFVFCQCSICVICPRVNSLSSVVDLLCCCRLVSCLRYVSIPFVLSIVVCRVLLCF